MKNLSVSTVLKTCIKTYSCTRSNHNRKPNNHSSRVNYLKLNQYTTKYT